AVAPHLPHSAHGLMAEKLGRAYLLQPVAALSAAEQSAFRAALDGFDTVVASGPVALAAGAGTRRNRRRRCPCPRPPNPRRRRDEPRAVPRPGHPGRHRRPVETADRLAPLLGGATLLRADADHRRHLE